MADLYRKSSIEKLSNPEQLDRAIVISKPMSWLALIGALLLIVVTLVWAFIGKLPTTVTVNGIVVSPASVLAINSDYAGTIESISKKAGDKIKAGDEVAKIKLADGKSQSVKAKESGVISQIISPIDTAVFAGSEIMRITPDIAAEQIVLCFAPVENAQQFKKDMTAKIYVSALDSQKYGYLEGTIVSVGDYPVSTGNLGFVLGNDNLMADKFLAGGPVVSVVLKLKNDSSTKSGYYWSNSNGKNLTLQNGAVVSGKIVVDECAPINKLFKSNN